MIRGQIDPHRRHHLPVMVGKTLHTSLFYKRLAGVIGTAVTAPAPPARPTRADGDDGRGGGVDDDDDDDRDNAGGTVDHAVHVALWYGLALSRPSSVLDDLQSNCRRPGTVRLAERGGPGRGRPNAQARQKAEAIRLTVAFRLKQFHLPSSTGQNGPASSHAGRQPSEESKFFRATADRMELHAAHDRQKCT